MQGSLRTSNNIRPGLFQQKCLCTSLQIWLELNVVWRTEQRFFRYIRGLRPSHLMNLLQTKLAKSCESFLVEFSLFGTGLAFFKTIFDALLRTFGLPLLFLPSKPSFLNYHLTTIIRIFNFFDKPMIEVCILMLWRSEAFLCWEGLSFMLIITKKKQKKEFVQFGLNMKICGGKIYTDARNFGAKIHESNNSSQKMAEQVWNIFFNKYNFC